jgi:hypothetical protein
MQAAVMAEYAAAGALIETAPTTRAGLRALESLLREDRSSSARWCIRMPTECGYYLSSDRPEGVDWLIAKLAAEIGMAAVHAG